MCSQFPLEVGQKNRADRHTRLYYIQQDQQGFVLLRPSRRTTFFFFYPFSKKGVACTLELYSIYLLPCAICPCYDIIYYYLLFLCSLQPTAKTVVILLNRHITSRRNIPRLLFASYNHPFFLRKVVGVGVGEVGNCKKTTIITKETRGKND